jgi:serine/threonine protein phosphatase PrpC
MSELPILYTERDSLEIDIHELPIGTVAVCSFKSPNKDSVNEDTAAIIPYADDGLVLVVADGLGGIRCGEVAARKAVETLRDTLMDASQNDVMARVAMIDAVEKANESILGLGLGAATTFAALEIQTDSVRPYHIGDSVIMAVGQRGRIKMQTVPHSPVGFAVEAGVMDEREAMHHEDRHIVSNVIGIPEMSLEVGSGRKLAQRDTVILASDGLLDNLHLDEILERIRVGPIKKAAERLCADCLKRMQTQREGQPHKPDDLTFILYRPKMKSGSSKPKKVVDSTS